MDKNQFQALGRVLKKLSALRATLRTDDAQVLDALIFGEQEVALHSMKDQVQSRFIGQVQPRLDPRAADQAVGQNVDAASEVAMHGLDATSGKAILGRTAADQATPKNIDAAAEVAMHSMDASPGKAQLGPEGRTAADQATPKNVDAAAEVAMHSMDANVGQAADSLMARIVLDEDGNYAAVDAAAD